MARRVGGICAVAVVALIGHATSALAARPPIFVDPQANSPAGVIYSIPLDSARQDAAPHGHYSGSGRGHPAGPGATGSGGGATGGGGAGGGGATGGGAGGGGGTGGSGAGSGSSQAGITRAAGGTPVLVPGGQPGSLIHSSNGFGSSAEVPGLNAPASAGFRAVLNDRSDAPLLAILLAAVVLALGVFAGARSSRASQIRARQPIAALPAAGDSSQADAP